jgi:hypothetical protein
MSQQKGPSVGLDDVHLSGHLEQGCQMKDELDEQTWTKPGKNENLRKK